MVFVTVKLSTMVAWAEIFHCSNNGNEQQQFCCCYIYIAKTKYNTKVMFKLKTVKNTKILIILYGSYKKHACTFIRCNAFIYLSILQQIRYQMGIKVVFSFFRYLCPSYQSDVDDYTHCFIP